MKIEFNLMKLLMVSGLTLCCSAHAVEEEYDFEISTGNDIGPIEGSNGWNMFSVSSNSPQVSDANPKAGVQHLRIQKDEFVNEDFPIGISSPNLGMLPINMVSNVVIDISVSNIGGANYLINGREISTNSIAWTVKLDSTGNILIWDNIGSGFEFQDTTISWPINNYFNLSVMVNPIDGFVQFSIDDIVVYTTLGALQGLTVDSIDIYSNNSQLENEFADIDNIRINNIDLIFINGFEGVQ